jgi:hypothetical protein
VNPALVSKSYVAWSRCAFNPQGLSVSIMANPMPAAVAGTSQLRYLPDRPVSAALGPAAPERTRDSVESPDTADGSAAAVSLSESDEAKRTTVDAAVPVFMREFPDFTEDACRESLAHCYRPDIPIHMCDSSSLLRLHGVKQGHE